MPTTVASYTNLPGTMGGPLSLRRSGQSRFALPDLQGNVRQLTDGTQTVTDTLTTDAFGVQKASSGSTVNPYKAFGGWGYFTDTPSRLYVRRRHLRVDLGGWLSRDPVPIPRLSPYLYAGNNPAIYVDPTGTLHEVPIYIDKWRIGVSTQPPDQKCCCGAFDAFWEIRFDNLQFISPKGLAPCTGVVVQKVELAKVTYNCPPDVTLKDIVQLCLYEFAGSAKIGQPLNYSDEFSRESTAPDSGIYYIKGEPKLLCGVSKEDLSGWRYGFQDNCTDELKTNMCTLCKSDGDPDWWTNAQSSNEKTGLYWATTDWNCCPNCGKMHSQSIAYPSAKAPKAC